MSLYQIKTEGSLFRIVKFDNHWEVQTINHVYYSKRKWHCTCQRGSFPNCRHRIMQQIFMRDNKIDSGWFYDWEQHIWLRPVNDPVRVMLQKRSKVA